RAESGLSTVVDEMKEDFEYSAAMVAAVSEEKNAWERYTAARERVLKQVAQDRRYHTLASLCSDLNERLFQLKAHPEANAAEIRATAELKLAYARQMSEMESDALKGDSDTQDARAKYMDATSRLTEMRAAFARSVRRDHKFVAAKKEMED